MVQSRWKFVWRVLKKLKIKLSYDSTASLLSIYTKKKKKTLVRKNRDFSCGPVAKTLHSQCRGPGFNP